MTRASVTDAKNRLSALLDRVRNGESVLIEDRGVAIAVLAPVAGVKGTDADRLAALERAGTLRAGSRAGTSQLVLGPPPAPRRRRALSKAVADERSAGW